MQIEIRTVVLTVYILQKQSATMFAVWCAQWMIFSWLIKYSEREIQENF